MLTVTVGMTAKPKKDKADATTAATTQVKNATAAGAAVLKNGSDSVSYAAGCIHTEGLMEYLQQQFNFDPAYMPDFIEGLKEAKAKGIDPRANARAAAAHINTIVQERMIKGVGKELEGSATPMNEEKFYEGFFAAIQGDTATFSMQNAQKLFQSTMQANRKVKAEKAKKEGVDWLKENQTKPGVVTTASGLQYKVITMGTGERPKADQEVEVKYEGHLIDGTVFDSSYKRNPQTTKFKCNQVIKGWTEGLQLMPVGSKFEFYIPQELAYGERGMGQNIPPYSTLIFTVELVGIK